MSADETILQKADFGSIYDQPDPRAYFNTLAQFDYAIPQEGASVFRRLMEDGSAHLRGAPTLLDVCCSYGIVSALLKTDLDIGDIYRHYAGPEVASMSNAEITAADRKLLQDHHRVGGPRVIGLDIAKNAVDYAVAIGALDAGVAENLEQDEPSPQLSDLMADVDLITTTGGIGYVTERTFDRLLAAAEPSTRVAAFCLRTYDYGPIAHRLAERGLQTECSTRTFRQRRFVDAEEQAWALERVRERGLDPAGKEDDGYYHAELYLSRLPDEVAERSLDEILPPLV